MAAEGVDPDPAVDPEADPVQDPVQDPGVPQLILLLEGTPLGEAVIGIIAIRQKDHGLDQNQNPDQNPGQNPGQNPDLGQDLELKDQNPDQNPDLITLKNQKKKFKQQKDYEIDYHETITYVASSQYCGHF